MGLGLPRTDRVLFRWEEGFRVEKKGRRCHRLLIFPENQTRKQQDLPLPEKTDDREEVMRALYTTTRPLSGPNNKTRISLGVDQVGPLRLEQCPS